MIVRNSAAAVLFLFVCCVASAQNANDSDRAAKAAIDMLRHREVPEASLPCIPDECKWWSEIKKTGEAIRNRLADPRDVKKFHELLKEGQSRSFQPPVPNRAAMVLHQEPLRSTEKAVEKNITGGIALVVELRADGTVGTVRVVQGLGYGLDERAIEAAQKVIFLPAVHDRAFTSMQMPMTMSISTRRTYP